MAEVTQGQIPGADYSISGWSITKLRQWIQTNFSQLLPNSLQVSDVTANTVHVTTSITLTAAALRDLKNQLGLP